MASSRVMASSPSANSDLTRQSSACSLPIADLQSSVSGGGGRGLGKTLGSMSMEDLFRNIYGGGRGGEGGDPMLRQGSFVLPKVVGEKAVEEVWRQMGADRRPDGGDGSVAEMTLEDFLARAGAVGEEDVGVASGWSPVVLGPSPIMVDRLVQQQQFAAGLGKAEGAERGGRGKKRPMLDPVDRATLQRQKRMIKNRESAARSRERKQAYIAELESLVARLEQDKAQLLRSLEELKRTRFKQLTENVVPVTESKRPNRPLRRTSSMEW
ncbi:bZIP transcription factor 12-like isoform X1 [Musa acuminata AAA Group]|uniref:bZIP transcription factor 12-like isoform X1 n=1 Tax=Musa acuminata AAA Group TaxID=214697 RepID=UPI0031D023BF